MALTRIDSYLLDLDAIGGIDFDVQNGTPTLKVDETTHRVGVGNNAPAVKFDVRGTADAPTLTWNGSGQTIIGDTANQLSIGRANSSPFGLYLQARASNNAARDILLNPVGGDVGIGTDDPDGALNVYSTNPTRVVIEGDGQSTAAAALVIKSNDADSNYRATGVFYYDATSQTEWFSGRPYTGSDTFAIHRKTSLGGSTGNTTAHPDNSLFVINSSGNVGVGNTTPAAKLEVSGDAIFTQTSASIQNDCLQIGFTAPNGFIKSKNSSGSPASNLDFYSTDTSGNTNLGIRLQYTGNVGIGTDTNLTANLTVGNIENTSVTDKGATAFKTLASTGGVGESAIYIEEQSGSEGWYLKVNSSGDLQFNDSGVSDRITFQDGGNVGIGEDSPDVRLHVKEQFDTAYSLTNVTIESNHLFKLENPSTTANAFAGMHFRVGSGADLFFGAIQQSVNDGDFFFANQNSPQREMMRIKSNGNVGIGTDDPGQRLQVQGGHIDVTDGTAHSYSFDYGKFTAQRSSSQSTFEVFQGGYGATITSKIYADGKAYFSNNVGIGTDSPDTRLHIEAPWTAAASTNDIFTVARAGDAVKFVVGYDAVETDMYLGTNTNHTLQIRTNNSAQVTITNTGNVGIGLTDPQQKLTVRGLNEQILLDLNSSTNGDYSSIAWNGTQGDLGTGSYTAEIRGYRSAAGAHGDLTFHTRDGFGTSNEIVRITSSRNVGIGTASPYTPTKLTITPDNRQTQFDASNGYTWHDVVIKQNDTNASGGNAVGIAFEISTSGWHNNAGTGIAAIKDSNSSDYGCHLAFITRPHSAVAEERMRITADGKVNISSDGVFRDPSLTNIQRNGLIVFPSGPNGNSNYSDNHMFSISQSQGSWLDGETGTNHSSWGPLWSYHDGSGNYFKRAGIQYDHASSEQFKFWSSYGDFVFKTDAARSGNDTAETCNNEALRIKYNGNIGIGTDNPVNKLTVGTNPNSYSSYAFIHNPNGADSTTRAELSNNAALIIQPHATNSTHMAFGQVNSGGGVGIQVTNYTKTADWDICLNPFGGDVGVNTTAPRGTLDVVGDAVTSSYRVGVMDRWKIRGNNSNQELCFEYATSSTLSDANIKARFDANGNFGIGVNPSAKLDVEGLAKLGGGNEVSIGYAPSYSSGFYYNNISTDNHATFTIGLNAICDFTGSSGNFNLRQTQSHSSIGLAAMHMPGNGSSLVNNILFYSVAGPATVGNTVSQGSWELRIHPSGVQVAGSFSKGSGSFKIDHPLPEKSETHNLVHSFVESPQANNIYRGKVTLANGSASINLDEVSGMTEGTFVLLNRDIHCFTSNESDWDAVRGSVNGNILTIECQNSSSIATVAWLVIGERHDQHMYDTDWTDENGKVIVEPLK